MAEIVLGNPHLTEEVRQRMQGRLEEAEKYLANWGDELSNVNAAVVGYTGENMTVKCSLGNGVRRCNGWMKKK